MWFGLICVAPHDFKVASSLALCLNGSNMITVYSFFRLKKQDSLHYCISSQHAYRCPSDLRALLCNAWSLYMSWLSSLLHWQFNFIFIHQKSKNCSSSSTGVSNIRSGGQNRPIKGSSLAQWMEKGEYKIWSFNRVFITSLPVVKKL